MDSSSPLFQAHQHGRKAENLLRQRRFEDALECHLRASEFLSEAMTLTRFSRALESLQLQYDFHKKQTDLIRVRKIQFELKKKILLYKRQQQLKMANEMEDNVILDNNNAGDFNDITDDQLPEDYVRASNKMTAVLQRMKEFYDFGAPDAGEVFLERALRDREVQVELRAINAELQSAIRDYNTFCQAHRKEVEDMRAELRKVKELPELPPLEMPKFKYPKKKA